MGVTYTTEEECKTNCSNSTCVSSDSGWYCNAVTSNTPPSTCPICPTTVCPDPPPPDNTIIYLVVFIILLLLGGGAVYYMYNKNEQLYIPRKNNQPISIND